MRPVRQLALVVVCAVAMATLMALPASADAINPGVVGVSRHVAGKSYAEWSAAWWRWVLRTPVETGGPFDSGTVDCVDQQPSRKVVFLTAPFNLSGSVQRTCKQPLARGTYIFFPLITVECSDVEAVPFHGDTPAERRACVHQPLFNTSDLHARVDGQAITHLRHYQVTSDDFGFKAVPGNPGIAVEVVTRGRSTSRGIWLLLKPLPRGEHTISFGGSFPNVPFTVSTVYHLTVR
jgi:hypothetical protein